MVGKCLEMGGPYVIPRASSRTAPSFRIFQFSGQSTNVTRQLLTLQESQLSSMHVDGTSTPVYKESKEFSRISLADFSNAIVQNFEGDMVTSTC